MHLRKLSMKLRHFDCARVFIALIVCVCPMYGCSAKRSVADQYWHWRGGKQFDRLTTIHFSGAVTDEGVHGLRKPGCPLGACIGSVKPANRSRPRFRNRKAFSPPLTATRVPLDAMLGNRVLPIRVEGRLSVPVIFDLGNGSALDLFPSYWEPQQLLRDRQCENSETGGAGGKQPVHKCVFQSVSIGGTVVKDVVANLTSPGATTENSEMIKGNVGVGILSRFRVITDYADNALDLLAH